MSPANPLIMVVMPTYNEAGNLPRMTQALFDLQLPHFQMLVVDDNSPDGTGQLAEDLSAQYDGAIHVLHRQHKEGLGPAYIAGFRHALSLGAEILVQMDADGSHQPHYILEMRQQIETHDVVLGSRFIKGGGVDPSWGWHRKLLSLWANRLYTPTILGVPVYDATGGYRMWRRDTLIGMGIDRIHANGYVFQVEMIYIAYKLGYRIAEIPIFFPDREIGDSKMSTSVALEAALRVWDLRWRYRHLTPEQRHVDSHDTPRPNS